ncbi:hypothetical protein J2S20_002403 [Moryella indoligenes]|uniref:Uncharacterized protein n=1 Tax=Moryella indoligenes TaxID=371674 RepID=A0AAE3VCB9_9FIRM|nr:hypothetical protein [Moryella indoligenes]MDQ0153681.1 hypothetical protein [Moryella indoligenes]
MDKETRSVLALYSKRSPLSIHDAILLLDKDHDESFGLIAYMVKHNYLCTDTMYRHIHHLENIEGLAESEPLYITVEGRTAFNEEQHALLISRWSELRNWLSFFIALIALILSIKNSIN